MKKGAPGLGLVLPLKKGGHRVVSHRLGGKDDERVRGEVDSRIGDCLARRGLGEVKPWRMTGGGSWWVMG